MRSFAVKALSNEILCVVTCAVPVKKLAKAGSRDKALGAAEHALLFRVCKYGNNKHKKKYSTTVLYTHTYTHIHIHNALPETSWHHCSASTVVAQITAAGHAQFHAALSQIIKTKVDVASLKDAALHPGAKRVVTSKKATA